MQLHRRIVECIKRSKVQEGPVAIEDKPSAKICHACSLFCRSQESELWAEPLEEEM